MKLKHTFPAYSGDYFGYVNPTCLMEEIDEGVAMSNFEDGVGFAHLFPAIGVTWMLGQCVVEYLEPVMTVDEVEITTGGHEQHGPAVVRRCTMYHRGKEAMRFKSLVTFTFRGNTANAKSVLSVLGACVKSGDEIEFVCEGEDEQEALKTLVAAVENGLGE